MDQQSFIELGKFLRQKRLRRKLTQVEVASSLGYTSQFIANWERGVSSPPLDAFGKLLDIYGISQKEFVGKMSALQRDYIERVVFNKKVAKKA